MPTGDYLSGRHYFFAHFLYDGLLFFQWVVRTRVLGLEDNLMTNEQKAKIAELRSKGCGYKAVADLLGIGKDTIKSYCQRNKLSGERAVHTTIKNASGLCPQCGKPVVQIPGMKPRRFCSTECRVAWWNTHQDHVRQKAVYAFTCETCGHSFTAYGNQHRKYCSHNCYIAGRFKGGPSV